MIVKGDSIMMGKEMILQLTSITYAQSLQVIRQAQGHHGFLMEITSSERNIRFIPAHFEQNQTMELTSGYYIEFLALKEEDHVFKPTACLFPKATESEMPYRFEHLLDEMVTHFKEGSDIGYLRANGYFQELVSTLLDKQQEMNESIEARIAQSKRYIETHYHQELTREQLAERTELQVDYYARKFKEHVKMSPMAYVNHVRLQEAKKLLLESRLSVHAIARQVGFNDEFYFSRKFKRKEGYAPSVYSHTFKQTQRIASLNHLVTGHLIALGVKPYAAIIDESFPALEHLMDTKSIGEKGPDLERLLAMKPDLLVRTGKTNQSQTQKEALLTHIAPTIVLNYQDDWRAHLNTIAKVIGREKEAAAFLTAYREQVENVKERIREKVRDERVLIIGIGDGTQCIYGKRNIGSVLYGDLHVRAPEGIDRIAHIEEVSVQRIAAYEPDRIIVTVYRKHNQLPSNKQIRMQLSRLQNNPVWQSMRAVKDHHVHEIFAEKHLYTSYNAYSHKLMLQKFAQLIG